MNLLLGLLRPISKRTMIAWMPLALVGVISCFGLSLALGFRAGVFAQHHASIVRDGAEGLQPRNYEAEFPLRSSRLLATGYGQVAATAFVGTEGQPLGIPGIPRMLSGGTALVSPAARSQYNNDWTGELGAWLDGNRILELPPEGLTHPNEMAIVEFLDSVPPEIASTFHPVDLPTGYRRALPDTSFVVIGLLALIVPLIALARAGVMVFLSLRSRRYSLLRVLGASPSFLAILVILDISLPLLLGGFIGISLYTLAMSSLHSFTAAGASYWASDLKNPAYVSLALPLITLAVGLLSVIRMVIRTSRNPVDTIRRKRSKSASMAYILALGAIVGPAMVFASAQATFSIGVWLISIGLLLSVLGLEGLSSVAVFLTGKVVGRCFRAPISGSRLPGSSSFAYLGVSSTAIAVLFIVFIVYANFEQSPPDVGDFSIMVDLPVLTEPARIVESVSGVEGVSRVVTVGRHAVEADIGAESIYTMTCDGVDGAVELDSNCTVGSIYLSGDSAVHSVTTRKEYPDTDDAVIGTFPVSGTVTGTWILGSRPVLMVTDQPVPLGAILLITTDESSDSLRRVIEFFRQHPEESYLKSRAALTSNITRDTLVVSPYMVIVAATVSVMGSVALLYGALLLLRQRVSEFQMLRCLGATRALLSVDTSLLFAIPLIVAFGLALASGLALAFAFNSGFDVSSEATFLDALPILATMLAVGSAASVMIGVRAFGVRPLVSDPDASLQ